MDDKILTSRQNLLIKNTIKLKQKKYRLREGLFLVEGHHLVKEAEAAGVLKTVFSVDETDLKNIETIKVSEEVITLLSDVSSNQGIVAICRIKEPNPVGKRLLLLDNLQDPGNIGTLIRSAVAFGFTDIVADSSVDFYNDKVIRSSQGAIFKINLISCNLLDFIETNPQIAFYVTDLKSQNEIDDMNFNSDSIAIILGNEGNGVRSEVIAKAQSSFKLKMDRMESLNVGVAGSIILYEIAKRSEKWWI